MPSPANLTKFLVDLAQGTIQANPPQPKPNASIQGAVSNQPEIAIILPVYNEAARSHYMRQFIDKLYQLRQLETRSLAVYFINDGSSDDTEKLVDQLIANYTTRSPALTMAQFKLNENTRKAGLFITAGRHIAADIFLFVDADDSFAIADIQRMLDILRESNYDGVIATKKNDHRARARRLVTDINGWLVRPFLPPGVSDSQTGLKAFRAESFRQIFPSVKISDGFAADLVLLHAAKKQRLRILQLPVTCAERPGSHVHLVRDSLRYLVIMGEVFWQSLKQSLDKS